MPLEAKVIVPAEFGGLGFDVRVRPDPARYDAKTVISMVKLVNRRGRVRYFFTWEQDGTLKWIRFEKPKERIKRFNDLREWLREALDADDLYVSFSDRFEARKFCADLTALRKAKLKRGPKPKPREVRNPAPQL